MKNLGTIEHCFLCPWKEYRATTGIAFCDNPNGDKFDITDKYLDCGINPKCPLPDFNEQPQFSLVVPSDEDMLAWTKTHGYYGTCTSEYHEGLYEGAKWAISQILKSNGQADH